MLNRADISIHPRTKESPANKLRSSPLAHLPPPARGTPTGLSALSGVVAVV